MPSPTTPKTKEEQECDKEIARLTKLIDALEIDLDKLTDKLIGLKYNRRVQYRIKKEHQRKNENFSMDPPTPDIPLVNEQTQKRSVDEIMRRVRADQGKRTQREIMDKYTVTKYVVQKAHGDPQWKPEKKLKKKIEAGKVKK